MTLPTDDGPAAVLHRAGTLCDLHRYDQACELLGRLIGSDPQSAEAHCLRARAELGRGQPHVAVQAARTASSIDPSKEWPHRLASVAWQQLKQPVLAAEAAREAVRLAPQLWQPHARYAIALAGVPNQLAEAEAAARRAVQLGPHAADAALAAGMVAAAAKDGARAADSFRRALAIDPAHTAAQNELARLQLRHGGLLRPGAWARAAQGFSGALRADPRAAVSRHNLDVTMTAFLTRVAYLSCVVSYLSFTLAEWGASSGRTVVRLTPLLLLGVPAVFGWGFVRRLPADLRRYLWTFLLRDRVRMPAVLLLISVMALVGAALVPAGGVTLLAVVAVVAAILGRIVLADAARKLRRPPR